MEEIQFLAEATVITLFGFGQHFKISVLILRRSPGRTVDALQHFVLAVAAPVGTRHLHELKDLEFAGRRHVRSAAEIDEVALTVKRNHFTRRNRFDDFRLIVFAHILEELHGGVAIHFAAFDRNVLLHEFMHTRFNRRQIFRREGTFELEVVIETVFNRRSDRHLSRREQFLHGLCHEVRRRMANDFKPFGILAGDDGHRSVSGERMGQIHELTVYFPRESRLRKPRTDRLRHVRNRHTRFILPAGSVGQRYRDHHDLLSFRLRLLPQRQDGNENLLMKKNQKKSAARGSHFLQRTKSAPPASFNRSGCLSSQKPTNDCTYCVPKKIW